MKTVLLAALLAAGLTAAAFAQGAPPTHVRGVVVSLEGNVLTVGAVMGPATQDVVLTPDCKVRYVVTSSLAAIVPGSWIGTVAIAQRDGSLRALEVHVFPPGEKPGGGSHPYDLGAASTMTNGNVESIGATKVDNVAAGMLKIGYDGGEKTVTVPPDVPIVTFEPADASALIKGARVSILVTKNADGTLSATTVNVGKDGLVPPM